MMRGRGRSKTRRGRQDRQTAGKGSVIRGFQRKHFRTGLVEQAAAPPLAVELSDHWQK